MVKVYPPFVNYFEMTKETVTRCDREIPRFHAFLKVNELLISQFASAQTDCLFVVYLL